MLRKKLERHKQEFRWQERSRIRTHLMRSFIRNFPDLQESPQVTMAGALAPVLAGIRPVQRVGTHLKTPVL